MNIKNENAGNMTNSLGKSCKDYSFWQPCWWSAIFLPLHLFGESIHNSQALPSIPGDKTLSACYFKTRWCWESLHKLIIQCNTFFCNGFSLSIYGPASCKVDGTVWQYLSIRRTVPVRQYFLFLRWVLCDNLFLVMLRMTRRGFRQFVAAFRSLDASLCHILQNCASSS